MYTVCINTYVETNVYRHAAITFVSYVHTYIHTYMCKRYVYAYKHVLIMYVCM